MQLKLPLTGPFSDPSAIRWASTKLPWRFRPDLAEAVWAVKFSTVPQRDIPRQYGCLSFGLFREGDVAGGVVCDDGFGVNIMEEQVPEVLISGW